MIVTVHGDRSAKLLGTLDAARVAYTRPPIGIEIRAGQVVTIAEFSAPTLAGIIISWLGERPSRIVTISTRDGTTWHARGKSLAEVQGLLTGAKEIVACEMETLD